MAVESMLTTYDNPYSPFTEFDRWYQWDLKAGYNTSGLLARLINYSGDLSESDQRAIQEATIDEIVRENVTGMYRKVTQEVVVDETRTNL